MPVPSVQPTSCDAISRNTISISRFEDAVKLDLVVGPKT